MTPTAQSRKKPSKGSPEPLVNIVTECFRRDNRVALSRLVSFEISWTYADGIWSGVVWVMQPSTSIDRTTHAIPLWYQCVEENHPAAAHATNWYRKFALYEMIPEQLDRVRSCATLRAIALRGCFQCCHTTGMPLSPTRDEYLLSAQVEDLLGADGIAATLASLKPVPMTKFHTTKLYGWFQR